MPPHPWIFYLPNMLTLGRVVLVPWVVWCILNDRFDGAFWWFIVAGASDALDGMIARMFSARTRLGGYLDPLADKVLLLAVFAALTVRDLVPGWLVLLIVGRDATILVGVAVLIRMGERLAMHPLVVGKLNTMVLIGLAGLVLAVQGLGMAQLSPYVQPTIWIAALCVVASCLTYVTRGIAIIRTRSAHP